MSFGFRTFVSALFLSAGAAAACPDWSFNGDQYAFTGQQLYQPQRLAVLAGGDQRLAKCRIPFGSDQGDGFVTVAPDFTVQISGLSRYQLVVSVYSECDSVLLLNTGNENWFYDDDDNADSQLDARILLTRPRDGIYDFWVGTHDGSTCNAVFELETYDR